MTRRDAIKVGAFFVDPLGAWAQQTAPRRKRVIVAGGGLAGLVCAYELNKRGHDVTVLEAAARIGGHVRTAREGLDDGLYADAGGEHFTKPGYDICWNYFKELNLPVLDYPHREKIIRVIDGRMVTEEEAAAINRTKTAAAAFNQREMDYLKKNPRGQLSALYLDQYIEKIKDEYQPFGVGLDELDNLSVTELLKRDGASEAAIQRLGSPNSALHSLWKTAIVRMRNVGDSPRGLYRIKGGNSVFPETLAQRLGDRIQTNSPVTAIRHDSKGVTVTYGANGQEKTVQGDYLACCMNAIMLRKIPATPVWPESKLYAINNIPYTVETKHIFQSATKFWKRDGYTGNMSFGAPVGDMWPMAEEVPTPRGLLIGTSPGPVTTKQAVATSSATIPASPPISSALCRSIGPTIPGPWPAKP